MKKIIYFMVAVAMITTISCAPKSPKATFNSEIDSLSYAIGFAHIEGFYDYLVQQKVDTAYIADFLIGFNIGAKTEPKDVAYAMGVQVGQMVARKWIDGYNQQFFMEDPTQFINKNNLLAGFIAAVKNDTSKMTHLFAKEYQRLTSIKIQEANMLKLYGENKAAGEKFIAENRDKKGVVTTESGLQYKIIKQGKGAIPTEDSTVKVLYIGTLIDGTEFDSSIKRNAPATFNAQQVIKGWTEALTMMPVGSKWELYIPQELAYGSRQDNGAIKPFSALIFEVELLEIVR